MCTEIDTKVYAKNIMRELDRTICNWHTHFGTWCIKGDVASKMVTIWWKPFCPAPSTVNLLNMFHRHSSWAEVIAISIFMCIMCLVLPTVESAPKPCQPNLRGCTEVKANVGSQRLWPWGPQMPQLPLPIKSRPGTVVSYSNENFSFKRELPARLFPSAKKEGQ